MGFLNKLSKLINKENIPPVKDLAAEQGEDISPISLDIDEEDKLIVALSASIMAAKDKNNSYYHISKITRIE